MFTPLMFTGIGTLICILLGLLILAVLIFIMFVTVAIPVILLCYLFDIKSLRKYGGRLDKYTILLLVIIMAIGGAITPFGIELFKIFVPFIDEVGEMFPLIGSFILCVPAMFGSLPFFFFASRKLRNRLDDLKEKMGCSASMSERRQHTQEYEITERRFNIFVGLWSGGVVLLAFIISFFLWY